MSCKLEFSDVAAQRSHMKTEWHRYNLKRRVAQLPAIDEDTFNSKIAALSLSKEDDSETKQGHENETKKQQKERMKEEKRKLLAAREALRARRGELVGEPPSESEQVPDEQQNEKDQSEQIKSGQAKSVQGKSEQDISEQDLSEEALMATKLANRVDIPVTSCLFCPLKSQASFETVDDNISHMFSAHGLYIPERNYLVDKIGLIKYLGEKLGLGNVCLLCSYQGKSLDAVREHMLRKRHMRIPYETEEEKLEISDFYDFSSTYSGSNPSASLDEGEWEDVTDDENEGGEDEDGYNSNSEDANPILNMGTELVLPNGTVLGHRSLARYYRQNLTPERVLSEGQGTVVAAETRHFMSQHNKHQLNITKRAWSLQKKREDTNDRRAAKFINNQPHFRDPLLQ